jgi:hypothetical protein
MDLEKRLEEIREALFDIRAFCYDQAKFFDRKLKELGGVKDE